MTKNKIMTEEEYREELYNEVIQNFDYLTEYNLTGDEVQNIVSDIVEYSIYKINTNHLR